MNVLKTDSLTWEPLTVTVVFLAENSGTAIATAIKDYCLGWFNDRHKLGVCDCKANWIRFEHGGHRNYVRFTCEWMCEKCVQILAKNLGNEFAGLTQFIIGMPTTKASISVAEQIRVPERKLAMEDSSVHVIKPFTIAKRPISIREFDEFVKATGYTTLAEQQSAPETFRDNQALSGLRGAARQEAIALFLSCLDAEAFCQFVGARLPTEQEWLAAAIKDFRFFSKAEANLYETMVGNCRKYPDSLIFSQWEFTATKNDDLVVARSGPRYLLPPDWSSKVVLARNRKVLTPSYYDILTSFRVIAN